MSADALLSRLDKVKGTGRGRWLACCPAHEDKSPSLSVRELDTGLVLLHCFSGCSVGEVLSALGLELGDLFPDGAIADRHPRQRRGFFAADILRALAHESVVLVMYARRLADADDPLQPHDRERLLLAATRIIAAIDSYA